LQKDYTTSNFSVHRPPSQHAAVNRRRRRTNVFLALITAVFFLSWSPMVLYSVFFEYVLMWLPGRYDCC